MKRKNFILPLMSAFILTFASCSQNFITNNGEAWATTYHIVYSSDQDLSDSIKAVIDMVDNELSMFNPASVLSTFISARCSAAPPMFLRFPAADTTLR